MVLGEATGSTQHQQYKKYPHDSSVQFRFGKWLIKRKNGGTGAIRIARVDV
ncbi:hypothetical protein ABZ532_25275 [Streptomyces sp. NPDC019396]|uniref:hypothetical protein n=1 Tax=Streptomyces sp. NPDC019396 TaxID=3154687 RepID=UPI00340BC0A6